MLTESLDDIKRLAGLVTEDELGAAMDAADSLETLAKEIYPGKPPAKVAAFLKSKMGEEGAKQFLLAKKAKAQSAYAKNSKPKPMPTSTDTYKGSGIKSKPLQYSKQSGPKVPQVKTGGGAMAQTKNWMQRHKK